MSIVNRVISSYEEVDTAGFSAHKKLNLFCSLLAHEALVEAGGNAAMASRLICVTRGTLSIWLGCSITEWKAKNGSDKRQSKDIVVEYAANAIRDFKRELTEEAMIKNDGNLMESAKELGIQRQTFTIWLGKSSKEWNRGK